MPRRDQRAGTDGRLAPVQRALLEAVARSMTDHELDFESATPITSAAIVDLPEKSDAALHAGSVGPWEPGGISPFQLAAGQALARAEGREYDSHGAAPA